MTNGLVTTLLWSTLVRVFIAAFVPLMGDEPYFAVWARNLDWSYYDHGGLTGWMIAPFLAMSSSAVAARMPAILMPAIIAAILYFALTRQKFDPPGNALAVTRAYLWNPWTLFAPFISTDTALLFSVGILLLGFTLLLRDSQSRSLQWVGYGLFGLGMALGISSKYLVLPLIGVGGLFLIYTQWQEWRVKTRPRQRLRLFWGPLFSVSLLGGGVYLHWDWNASHCYSTFLFNFVNRHASRGFEIFKPLSFFGFLLLTLGPATWIGVGRAIRSSETTVALRWSLLMGLVPLVALGVSSLQSAPSILWPIAFYPFVYFALGVSSQATDPKTLNEALHSQSLLRQTRSYALLYLPIILIICFAPTTWIKSFRHHQGFVFARHVDQIVDQLLKDTTPETVLATPGYSPSALIEFEVQKRFPGRPVLTLGPGSVYGRQEDLRSDFSTLNKKDFVFFIGDRKQRKMISKWFKSTRLTRIRLPDDVQAYKVVATQFRYKKYRKKVLKKVYSKFYADSLSKLSRPGESTLQACPIRDRHDL